jgi:hypothetical protein
MHRPPLRGAGSVSLLVLALLSASRGRAELLYFKAGGCLETNATVRDGFVRVDRPWGPIIFREADFVRIVAFRDPEAEWPSRHDAALKSGAEARLAAAWWALEHGLVEACESMVESASAVAPGDGRIARLARLVGDLRRPLPSPATDALRPTLPSPCKEAAGRHVLLLHQQDDETARARLILLDRIVAAYYLVFAFHGVDLPLPRQRLVSIHLHDHGSYERFLDSHNAGVFRSTQGYYHPTLHVVVTYDLRTTIAGSTLAAARTGGTADHLGGEGDRQRLLKEATETAYEYGTASHEMIHLLVQTTGLDGEPRRFPYWLHEGLATQFEVYQGGRWAGISRAHDVRLPDLRTSENPPALDLLLRDVGFGRGYRRDLYAGSWALVYFLQRTRGQELMTFLDLLRNPDTIDEEPDGDRYERLFRQAFGSDLRALQAEQNRFLSTLHTAAEMPAHTDH